MSGSSQLTKWTDLGLGMHRPGPAHEHPSQQGTLMTIRLFEYPKRPTRKKRNIGNETYFLINIGIEPFFGS